MCKFKPIENIVLLTEPTTEHVLPAIFYSVARNMAAFAYDISVRSGTQGLALQGSRIDASVTSKLVTFAGATLGAIKLAPSSCPSPLLNARRPT